MFGIRQHLGDFDLAGFDDPSIKNFQKQITLQIDKDRFGIFIATFGSAAAKRLLGRANINKAAWRAKI